MNDLKVQLSAKLEDPKLPSDEVNKTIECVFTALVIAERMLIAPTQNPVGARPRQRSSMDLSSSPAWPHTRLNLEGI